jgi:hypothetical protein
MHDTELAPSQVNPGHQPNRAGSDGPASQDNSGTQITTAGGVQPLEDLPVDEPEKDDLRFFSVTTILKALNSPALEYWAIKTTATRALDSPATISAMLEEVGRDSTINWLCKARYDRPKTKLGSDQLGTVTHKLCEEYALTGRKPDADAIESLVRSHAARTVDLDVEIDLVLKMLDQFDRWLQRFTPVYTAAEMAVFSRRYGYAGCLDAILTVGGVKLLTDYKTRREPLTAKGGPQRPYGETSLQLSAYRHADIAAIWRARRVEKNYRRYYLLNETENDMAQPIPAVDGGLCIIITPESCEAYPMNCGDEVFDYFLNTIEIFRWEEDMSKRVVGDALLAPGEGIR